MNTTAVRIAFPPNWWGRAGWWLLAARTLQGVGAAMTAPAVLAFLTSTFAEGRERTRALGMYTAVSIGGAAIGLISGGILTQLLSWRWVMFVNVPIGVAVLLGASLATLFGRLLSVGAPDLRGALRLDVERVQDHAQPTFAVLEGVRWEWTDADASRADAELRAALERQLRH